MVWRTHVLFGISSLWLVAAVPGLWDSGVAGPMAACAAIGALLPDIDAGTAKIAQLSVARIRPFARASLAARGAFGHRGVTHSGLGLLVFAGIAAVLVGALFGLSCAVAVALGYASHLVGDSCTVSGIPFLYPDRTRRYALPKPLRFVTGSRTEDFLLLAFAEACLGLYLPFLLGR